MSERMIELQRARLLAAQQGGAAPASSSATPTATQNGSQPSASSSRGQFPQQAYHPQHRSHSGVASSGDPRMASHAASLAGTIHTQTPQQAAVNAVHRDDQLLQRFLYRLQAREEQSISTVAAAPGGTAEASLFPGPTVPTALTRRILNKQGVGFLDGNVASVVSASADRFLATVLHQAAACRDQRLKGAEMSRQAGRRKRRHMRQFQADADDRKRRKAESERKRQASNLAAMEKAEELKKTGMTPERAAEEAAAASSKSKKKKKSDDATTNGNKPKQKDGYDSDDASHDSIDEEEDYYRSYYGDEVPGANEESDDETDEDDDEEEMLQLRDIARPLEAWDFNFTGMEGMYERRPAEETTELDEQMVDLEQDDEHEQQQEAAAAGQSVAGEEEPGSPTSRPSTASAAGKKGDLKSPPSGDGKSSPRPASRPTTPAAK